MKKALMLAGLVLCATSGFASEIRTDLTSEGKKRNEEAYERMLEETGWKKEKSARKEKSPAQSTSGQTQQSASPKSS